MSRNLALEKAGRARVAYMLQQKGWKVGEAFDDGYDLLAYHPEKAKVCFIELKAMDMDNRSEGVNLTAPISDTERDGCSHIIVYVEPEGLVFIAKKEKIITDGGNIFATIDKKGKLRSPKEGSKSFAPFQDSWDELCY